MRKFLVCIEDYHGDDQKDGWLIEAHSPEDAAEKAAERYHCDGDYPLRDDNTAIAVVHHPEFMISQRFRIGSYISVNYTAEEED